MKFFRRIHHWIVPHAGNNHRAKALHHDALFSYVLLFLLFNLGIRFLHYEVPGILGYATDIRVEQLLSSINSKRSEQGLGHLSLNSVLSQAAAAKAADMFTNNYWAHNSPSGKTPWDFITGAGYRYTLAGENLAKNFNTSDNVVAAWMASPTHRDNVLKSGYTEVGFAVVNGVLNGEETTLVVQMFGAGGSKSVANIPKVQAQEPARIAPEVTLPPQPAVTAAPVVEPVIEPVVEIAPVAPQVVIARPRFDIPTVTRGVVYVFIGIMMAILALDVIVVSRRRVVRVAGHNVAHIVFLTSVLLYSLFLTRGSLV